MRLLCSDKHTNVWRHCFVGRQVKCELFRTACQTETPSFTVLHLFAPGGAGKTALLAEFARIAAEAGVPAVMLIVARSLLRRRHSIAPDRERRPL